MGNPHLSPELVSALADGELSPSETAAARAHIERCAACGSLLTSFAAVDAELRRAPTVACSTALPLISASLDRETDAPDRAVVERHLAACASCRATAAAWSAIAPALALLPAGAPSARVDAAIAGLVRPVPRRATLPALVARSLVAVTAAVALVVTGLSRGAAPVATPVQDERVLVAAVQQVVFNARTNTLYVLDAPAAAVDARDVSTNDLKARIQVGGKPIALALNDSTNTLLVLDSSQKKLTEIDTTSNRVISSSTVAVTGTPTNVSVDPANAKIVVTSGATATTAGSVAFLDSATKKVESVRDFEVAPQSMVFSPSGDRAAVVSEKATTLLDGAYKPVATLPGGVAAAFAQGDDRIAVLSAKGSGSLVTYGGRAAPAAIEIAGSPRAIVSLPDGGFLVLVDLGDRSRVDYVVPDGHVAASRELSARGRSLVYDASSRRFGVGSGVQVSWADLPQTTLALGSPSPTTAPTTSAPPQTSAPTATPSTAPSASPSAQPTAAPSGATATPKPIDLAQPVTQNFVHLDLPNGRAPYAVSKSGERLWVLDDKNAIDVVDLSTGEISTLTTLPRSARITNFVAGRAYLYALDATRGELFTVRLFREQATPSSLQFAKPVSSITVGLDDRLWIGLSGASFLLRFDPLTKQTESFDLAGAQASRVTSDALGRIYYADDARNAVGMLDPTSGHISELLFARHGVTTALVIDGSSTLWLGTSAGEIWAVRGGGATLTVGLQRPVTVLSLDASGRAWYLAPLPSGAVGFGYAAADGARAGQTVAGPAFSLAFNALGRAWLADPRGGFWVSRGSE